jgi:two-component system phosphate regulon sensor histidine kinase PhoR
MWRSRIFWRWFGAMALLLVCSIGVLGTGLLSYIERFSLRQFEIALRDRAVLAREALGSAAVGDLQTRVLGLRQELTSRITLMDDAGEVLADSDEDPKVIANHADRPEVQTARLDRYGVAIRTSATTGQPRMYVALRLDDPPDGAAALERSVRFVRVSRSMNEFNEAMARLRLVVWLTAVATGILVMGLTAWLIRRFLHPLYDLTACAEGIALGDYAQKVYAAGHDEIQTLTSSFNRMAESLAVQFAQLDEDRQQLRTILGGMVEGVIALDVAERILFANSRAGELLEFQPPAAVGRKFWEIVRQRSLQDVVRNVLNGAQAVSEELEWTGPNAKNLTVHAARLPGPAARGAVLVLHDRSELRRLERLRQDFVANVSHELKTPLSVIKACIETLLDGAASDPNVRNSFLEQIATQAERLHTLILDLLSLARIESGNEMFVFEAVAIDDVVANCLERHHARAEANGQILLAEAEVAHRERLGPATTLAWADREAVQQIVDNLVDNALKYTPSGGRIVLTWKQDESQVVLQVADNGIGIPERDLPRIFERFYRVDKARSRELGGTGLGLAIVKHLVQALHGSIRATSRLGEGTRFAVTLPAASSP